MAKVTKTAPFEEAVNEIMSRVACTESEARLIAAIERGEIGPDDDYGHMIDQRAESKQSAA
jgi:hypothetical protein